MTQNPLLTEAAILADRLEENADFVNLIPFLREVAFVNLLEFCDRENWRRPLAEPFVQDGWLYATDARIAIRMPTRQPNTVRSDGVRLPRVDDVFIQYPKEIALSGIGSGGWNPWPAKPLELPTPADARSGVNCPLCDGGGHFWTADGETKTCVYCDGTGFVERYNNADIGGACFSGRYWRLIARLPNVWYLEPHHPDKPLWFRFAGGQGVLMPITDPAKAKDKSAYTEDVAG